MQFGAWPTISEVSVYPKWPLFVGATWRSDISREPQLSIYFLKALKITKVYLLKLKKVN